MLLLMVRNDDYYVACGDSVLAVLNQYDTKMCIRDSHRDVRKETGQPVSFS